VTGVQTCALPIWGDRRGPLDHHGDRQDQQRALRGSRSCWL